MSSRNSEFIITVLGPFEREQEQYVETWAPRNSDNWRNKSYGKQYQHVSPRNDGTFTLSVNQVESISKKSGDLTSLLLSSHVICIAFPIINNTASLQAISDYFSKLQNDVDVGIRKILSKTLFVVPSNYDRCRSSGHFRKELDSGTEKLFDTVSKSLPSRIVNFFKLSKSSFLPVNIASNHLPTRKDWRFDECTFMATNIIRDSAVRRSFLFAAICRNAKVKLSKDDLNKLIAIISEKLKNKNKLSKSGKESPQPPSSQSPSPHTETAPSIVSGAAAEASAAPSTAAAVTTTTTTTTSATATPSNTPARQNNSLTNGGQSSRRRNIGNNNHNNNNNNNNNSDLSLPKAIKPLNKARPELPFSGILGSPHGSVGSNGSNGSNASRSSSSSNGSMKKERNDKKSQMGQPKKGKEERSELGDGMNDGGGFFKSMLSDDFGHDDEMMLESDMLVSGIEPLKPNQVKEIEKQKQKLLDDLSDDARQNNNVESARGDLVGTGVGAPASTQEMTGSDMFSSLRKDRLVSYQNKGDKLLAHKKMNMVGGGGATRPTASSILDSLQKPKINSDELFFGTNNDMKNIASASSSSSSTSSSHESKQEMKGNDYIRNRQRPKMTPTPTSLNGKKEMTRDGNNNNNNKVSAAELYMQQLQQNLLSKTQEAIASMEQSSVEHSGRNGTRHKRKVDTRRKKKRRGKDERRDDDDEDDDDDNSEYNGNEEKKAIYVPRTRHQRLLDNRRFDPPKYNILTGEPFENGSDASSINKRDDNDDDDDDDDDDDNDDNDGNDEEDDDDEEEEDDNDNDNDNDEEVEDDSDTDLDSDAQDEDAHEEENNSNSDHSDDQSENSDNENENDKDNNDNESENDDIAVRVNGHKKKKTSKNESDEDEDEDDVSDLSSDNIESGVITRRQALKIKQQGKKIGSSTSSSVASTSGSERSATESFYSILESLDLTMYHDSFVESGFDTMNDIFALNRKELINLLENILGMTKLHENQFISIVESMKPSNNNNNENDKKMQEENDDFDNKMNENENNENDKKSNVDGFELTSMPMCPEKEIFMAMEDRIDEIAMIKDKISQSKSLIEKNKENGIKKLKQYFDEIRKIIDNCENKSIDDMTRYLDTRGKVLSQVESNVNDLKLTFNNCMLESQKQYLNGNSDESMTNMRQCMMQNHVSNNTVPSVSFDFQFSQMPHINKPILIPHDVPMYIPKSSPYSHAMMNPVMSLPPMNTMNAMNQANNNASGMDGVSPFGNMQSMMNFGNLAPLAQTDSNNNNEAQMQQQSPYGQNRRSSMPGMHIYASMMAQQAQAQAQAQFNIAQQHQQQARSRAASMGFGGYMMGSAFNDPMQSLYDPQNAMLNGMNYMQQYQQFLEMKAQMEAQNLLKDKTPSSDHSRSPLSPLNNIEIADNNNNKNNNNSNNNNNKLTSQELKQQNGTSNNNGSNKNNNNDGKPILMYTKTDLTHSEMREKMKVANLILQGKNPNVAESEKKIESVKNVKISWNTDKKYESKLWSDGSVKFLNKNRVLLKGSVCVIADIIVNKSNCPYFWEIYVRRPSNSFWIGFIPCQLNDNDNNKNNLSNLNLSDMNWNKFSWVSGECPPSNGFGIESEYGYWYIGKTYKGSGVGRCIRGNDHIRFRLDTRQGSKVCKGSIQSKMLRSTFHRGDDIPDSCIIAIVNHEGEGEFEIHNDDPEM